MIERELVELIEREIKYQQTIERMKGEILCRFDWSFEGAFSAIDIRKDGYLSADTFKLFLRLNGHTATIQELDAIIRRVDTNSDYLITLPEFIDLFKLKPIVQDQLLFPSEDKNARHSRFLDESSMIPATRINLSPNRCSPLRKFYG